MKTAAKLLLVESKDSTKEMFKEVAEELNLNLIIAEDGQEGLEVAGSDIPDLIVIRKKAPVLDALSMSVLLKQSEKTKDIPILVICADVSAAEQGSFRDAGCSGCIKEPFTREEIIIKIKEILP